MNEKKQEEFSFMQEQIKDRPINKKKLLRRTIITASMAVVFGLVACFTFLVLEPVFSNWLYPEETKPIVIPEDKEEILPEEMIQSEEELKEESNDSNTPQIVTTKADLTIDDYNTMYNNLYKVAVEAEKSMVNVTGVTSDEDWFNNPYESKEQASGIIVGDNGKEVLILVDSTPLIEAQIIKVEFCNNTYADATLKKQDVSTNLSVISVEHAQLQEGTLEKIKIADMGNSNASDVEGSPIIALGSPIGYTESVVYGMATSNSHLISMPDVNYKLMTTDIYGSQNATGVLVNLKGKVIGIISSKIGYSDNKNLISAYAISELKSLIEKLSNGKATPYLGLYCTDIEEQTKTELGIPKGIYVTEVALDSPAMTAGIQSGDIVVGMDTSELTTCNEYKAALNSYVSGDVVNVKVMRQGIEDYAEMSFDVTLRVLE